MKIKNREVRLKEVWTGRLMVDYPCDSCLRTMVGPDDSLNIKFSHPAPIRGTGTRYSSSSGYMLIYEHV